MRRLRGSGDGASDAPAHDQQRDKNYEEHLDEDFQKGLAPDAKALRMDIANVVHYCQPTHNFILAVQRQRKNLHWNLAHADERTLSVALCHGFEHFRRRRCKDCPQLGSDRPYLPLPVVDGNPQQMFAIAEALHQSL